MFFRLAKFTLGLVVFWGTSLNAQNGVTLEQCVGDGITNSANGATIGGLVLNNYCLKNGQNDIRSYKVATLIASADDTADHLHLLVTVNNNWAGNNNSSIDAVFGNRNGFFHQYTVRGAPITSGATLAAYQNTDGTVDIYIVLGANTWASMSYTILENMEGNIYSPPTYITSTPPGTLVFDASSSQYPAASSLDNSGNLTLQGNMRLTPGSGASITFPDNTIQSTAWNGTLYGGDYAESVDVTGDRAGFQPGDVLVADPEHAGRFLRSSIAYSKLVSGIYSTKPGLRGRRQTTDRTLMDQEVPMAMVGIVPTKVSAENGPISIGDLLVTSSTPGYAMKGTDPNLLVGAVVGKALGTLTAGTGVIEVLVTLQ